MISQSIEDCQTQIYVSIQDIADVIMGQSPPSETYNENAIGLPFFQGKTEFGKISPTVRKWCDNANKIAHPNDILVSVRAPVGAVNIASEICGIGRGLAAIRYKECYKFLYYFLLFIEHKLDEFGTGTTFRAISADVLRQYPINLPPLAEQHRIVAKIEELFSELDKGVETLKVAQQQLKVYRQAVLKYAFEGKLTNPGLKDGELPEGWARKSLKEASILIGDGLHGTPEYSDDGDYYFINGNNLVDGKVLIKSNTKKVNESQFLKYKKPLGGNTILLSINGTIGNLAFYNEEKVILGKSACFINLSNSFNKHFVRYVLMSKSFLNYALENATGSTIMNVGLKAVRDYFFNYPTKLENQIEIVQEIESRLSVCDKIEESIEQSLQQAEALRQSILKKAFEGKLVPQDPNDEPASVLLERIKAERASAQPEKKTRAKKAKA